MIELPRSDEDIKSTFDTLRQVLTTTECDCHDNRHHLQREMEVRMTGMLAGMFLSDAEVLEIDSDQAARTILLVLSHLGDAGATNEVSYTIMRALARIGLEFYDAGRMGKE